MNPVFNTNHPDSISVDDANIINNDVHYNGSNITIIDNKPYTVLPPSYQQTVTNKKAKNRYSGSNNNIHQSKLNILKNCFAKNRNNTNSVNSINNLESISVKSYKLINKKNRLYTDDYYLNNNAYLLQKFFELNNTKPIIYMFVEGYHYESFTHNANSNILNYESYLNNKSLFNKLRNNYRKVVDFSTFIDMTPFISDSEEIYSYSEYMSAHEDAYKVKCTKSPSLDNIYSQYVLNKAKFKSLQLKKLVVFPVDKIINLLKDLFKQSGYIGQLNVSLFDIEDKVIVLSNINTTTNYTNNTSPKKQNLSGDKINNNHEIDLISHVPNKFMEGSKFWFNMCLKMEKLTKFINKSKLKSHNNVNTSANNPDLISIFELKCSPEEWLLSSQEELLSVIHY